MSFSKGKKGGKKRLRLPLRSKQGEVKTGGIYARGRKPLQTQQGMYGRKIARLSHVLSEAGQ